LWRPIFLKYPRFWSPGSAGYPHRDFLKNFGLVGGLILIVLGSDLVAGIAPGANDVVGWSGAQTQRD
jgi:hypothetical protein